MRVSASVENASTVLTIEDEAGSKSVSLTPTEAMALTVQIAEAMQLAIVAGATPISDEESMEARIAVGPYSYETLGSEEGNAIFRLWPENWVCLEFELSAVGARAIGDSLINAAVFLEGGARRH